MSSHTSGENLLDSIETKLAALRDPEAQCPSSRATFLRRLVISQPMFSHYFKLVALFTIAVCHMVYMMPYLRSYEGVHNYVQEISYKYDRTLITPNGDDTRVLHYQLDVMNSYKQNIWMTIGSMCVALSTSSFFLFITPTTHVRKLHLVIMQTVDLIAFITIPILLSVRMAIVQAVERGLQLALLGANKVASSSNFEDHLQCSIRPRENIEDCAKVVMESVFPVVLLKYLLILCVMTVAYILLAYLIVYCIRHWFPHDKHVCCMQNKAYVPVFTASQNPPIRGILRNTC
ncbi:hypothetical protein L596_001687 [Steinernema carpocapsae]|uniref:Uncharacterized protein n=1 Tax=Steinernema carpocapsae TaxID=34508 RepID=A0A4U8UM77_STECR|nr:hypothetical protein L596_001687 [Steinernema carpocapsae]